MTTMQNIALQYGSEAIHIQLPARNILSIFRQQIPGAFPDEESLLEKAVHQPLEGKPLRRWAHRRRLLVLISDATREVPNEQILRYLLPELQEASFLQVLITTGTHQWNTRDNLRLRATIEQIFRNQSVPFAVNLHDSFATDWVDLGITSRGTPIRVNPLIQDTEGFLIISDVKPHYFGGYSNVVKHVVPGICAFQTAERNHSWTLDAHSRAGYHPWHPDLHRRENPLAEDMVEAFGMITANLPMWVLGIITFHNRLIWAAGGEPQTVMAEAFRQTDRWMVKEAQPADVLVVSPGGFPHDESLYISQRALELSRAALKPNGRLLFVSECRNGIGPPASIPRFYDPLISPERERLLRLSREEYTMYIHKPIRLLTLIQETRFFGMKSALPEDVVKKIGITPVDDVQSVLNQWLQTEPNLSINVVEDGNKLALFASNRGTV